MTVPKTFKREKSATEPMEIINMLVMFYCGTSSG